MTWESCETAVPPKSLEQFRAEHGFQLGLDSPLEVAIGDKMVRFGIQRTLIVSAQLV